MTLVFEKARMEAPCVLILEDLDSLINDANRSFFLNQLDGLENNDGLLVIGSTNHYDRLDPAITKRPSRFDRKLFVISSTILTPDAHPIKACLTIPPTTSGICMFGTGRRNSNITKISRSLTLSGRRSQTSHPTLASRT